MSDHNWGDPPHTGRRARRHGDETTPGNSPRGPLPGPQRSSVGARRALDNPEKDVPDAGTRWWRQPGWWAVAVALIVLVTLVLSLVITPSTGTSTPERALPVSTSPDAPTSTQASIIPPESLRPDPTGSTPSQNPATSVPALPNDRPASTVPPAPSEASPDEPSAELTPTGTVTVDDIQLDDARITVPEGWALYGDDQIENSRRVVRLSQRETDARLQATTLEPSGETLPTACTALVNFQQAQFTDVAHQLVSPIGVDAALGSAVQCGFTGIRASDGIPNTVTFTLVTRAEDSHVLMLRTTVPERSWEGSPVAGQLNAMTCSASTSFGVPLPLC